MDVEVRAQARYSSRVPRASLARLVRRVLRAERAPRAAGVTVFVTADRQVRELNRRFHATDASTDVLAFPSQPDAPRQPGRSSEPLYLGDVVISYETARRQARDAGWKVGDELELLAVHGVLHLLGYDDLKPRQRAKMWKRQEELLGRIAAAAASRAGGAA